MLKIQVILKLITYFGDDKNCFIFPPPFEVTILGLYMGSIQGILNWFSLLFFVESIQLLSSFDELKELVMSIHCFWSLKFGLLAYKIPACSGPNLPKLFQINN